MPPLAARWRRPTQSDPARSQGQPQLCGAGMANSCYRAAFIWSQVSGPRSAQLCFVAPQLTQQHSCARAGALRRPQHTHVARAGCRGQQVVWLGSWGRGETHLAPGSKLLASPGARESCHWCGFIQRPATGLFCSVLLSPAGRE